MKTRSTPWRFANATLTALALNCKTHRPNNFVFLKDDGAVTQFART
jgi:hypothetical protein